jgi:hypothetical protein
MPERPITQNVVAAAAAVTLNCSSSSDPLRRRACVHALGRYRNHGCCEKATGGSYTTVKNVRSQVAKNGTEMVTKR